MFENEPSTPCVWFGEEEIIGKMIKVNKYDEEKDNCQKEKLCKRTCHLGFGEKEGGDKIINKSTIKMKIIV